MKNQIFLKMYMHQNLGDDLFLQVLLERYPDVPFFLYADPKKSGDFSGYPNLTIGKPLLPRIGKKLGKVIPPLKKEGDPPSREASVSRATLMLGGSLFMEPRVPKLRNNLEQPGLPFYILGVNYGPAETEDFREACRLFFAGKTDICFRDKASFALFRDNPAARVAPDILFGLGPERAAVRFMERASGSAEKAETVFISVMDLAARFGEPGDILEKKLADETIRILQAGGRVILCSFCEYGGDERALDRILRDIKGKQPALVKDGKRDKRLLVLRYRGGAEQRRGVLRAIAASDAVIALRYHSIVLGLLHGKQVYPVCYSNKAENLLRDLGFEKEILRAEEVSEETNLRGKSISLSEEERKDLAKRAEQHFSGLDTFYEEFRAQ